MDPDSGDIDAYSFTYTYDKSGNLVSWGDLNEPFVLSYEDGSWRDLLTAFNGHTITYDAIGNPLVWHNGTEFTWANGRQLRSAVNGDNTVSYTYNTAGLRMTKTVNGIEHKYIWQGDKLISEYYDGKELEFFYDESGKPYAMSYKENENAAPRMYYYVTNLQGDILSMVDADGFSAAEYCYSAYGLPMGSSGEMADINPLRYRGYYFDNETGLYYLKSRYYDPAVCRFINADDIDIINENALSLTDKNLFSYCDNNPQIRIDNGGKLWNTIIGAVAGAAIGALSAVAMGTDIKAGIVSGAISGGVSGMAIDITIATGGVGLVALSIVSATSGFGGAIGSYVNQRMNGVSHNKIDWGVVAIDGFWNAIGGALSFGVADIGGPMSTTLKQTFNQPINKIIRQAVNDFSTTIAINFGTLLNGTKMNYLKTNSQVNNKRTQAIPTLR